MAGVGHGVVEGVGVVLGVLVGVWAGISATVWVADGSAVDVIMMVVDGAVVGGGSVAVGAGSVTVVVESGDGRTVVGFRDAPLFTPGTQAGKIQSKTITKQSNNLFMIDFPREL